MAKTTINDLGITSISLDSKNVIKTYLAAEPIYPGQFVFKNGAGTVRPIDGANSLTGAIGVACERYDLASINTQISSGSALPIGIEGKFAGKCNDPGAALYAGAQAFASGAASGAVAWFKGDGDWVALSGYRVAATLAADIANGDTVGIFNIRR